MIWLESTGGPFIMANEEDAKNWHGTNSSLFPDYFSDYEAACACDSYVEKLISNDYSFIIFNDEPYRTSIIVRQDGFFVVRWRWSDSDKEIKPILNKNLAIDFIGDEIMFSVKTGNVVLFDSSLDGGELTDKIDFSISAGVYRMTSAFYEPDYKTSFLVHRFVLV